MNRTEAEFFLPPEGGVKEGDSIFVSGSDDISASTSASLFWFFSFLSLSSSSSEDHPHSLPFFPFFESGRTTTSPRFEGGEKEKRETVLLGGDAKEGDTALEGAGTEGEEDGRIARLVLDGTAELLLNASTVLSFLSGVPALSSFVIAAAGVCGVLLLNVTTTALSFLSGGVAALSFISGVATLSFLSGVTLSLPTLSLLLGEAKPSLLLCPRARGDATLKDMLLSLLQLSKAVGWEEGGCWRGRNAGWPVDREIDFLLDDISFLEVVPIFLREANKREKLLGLEGKGEWKQREGRKERKKEQEEKGLINEKKKKKYLSQSFSSSPAPSFETTPPPPPPPFPLLPSLPLLLSSLERNIFLRQ